MTKREVASLGLKLLGVYALVTTLWVIPVLAGFVPKLSRTGNDADEYWLIVAGWVLQFGASLVAGFVLIRYSDRLAAKMVTGESAASPQPLATSGREWQAIAFSVLGLFLIATGFPRLAGVAAQLIQLKAKFGPDFKHMIPQGVWIGGIVPCVQIVLGGIFFFKARALVAWWDRSQQPVT